MKKTVLSLLLSAFAFFIVHDFVITSMDGETQTELVLHESGQLQVEAMCDTSKVHNHMHEVLIACSFSAYGIMHETDLKTKPTFYTRVIIPKDTSTRLYRPPIV